MNFKLNKKVPSVLDKVLKKTLGYLTISTVVLGSFNAANATDYTLTANDVWGDASSLTGGTSLTDPSGGDNVDLDGFVLTVVTQMETL